jgi:uncharacterized protein (TIGR01777 family)
MTKQILITGGSGFIGTQLVSRWLGEGHSISVLTRRPEVVEKRWQGRVTALTHLGDARGQFDWLINLAGEPIADQRWTTARKRTLESSRIGVTHALVAWAEETGQRFELVMSGSAIGYYGSFLSSPGEADPVLDEESPAGSDYPARLCVEWEEAAKPFESLSERLILLRTGVVLGAGGGMLAKLWLPFKFGLGGVIGSGRQQLSWIHISDYCEAVSFLISSSVNGPVNMTAPSSVSNRDMVHSLANCLNRPAFCPLPSFAAKAIFGEMSELLLMGQSIKPSRLVQTGFEFQYSDLSAALSNIRKSWETSRKLGSFSTIC